MGISNLSNSILKNYVEKFPGEIKGKVMESISLNNLISSQDKNVKWLHLDVEGIDTDLILSLVPENIKSLDFIIYESLNTPEERKEECKKFLEERGFLVSESGWNTLAIKN